jgi:hypothetical protein
MFKTLTFNVSFLIGAIIVCSTSPNLHDLYRTKHFSFLGLNAAVADLLIISTISYMQICHIEAKWLAKNYVPSDAVQLPHLFKSKGFNFQVLDYYIFHQEKSSRVVHATALILQTGLWATVVHITFGRFGSAVLVLALSAQALSYGDKTLAAAIIALQLSLMAATELTLPTLSTCYSELVILEAAKTGILWSAFSMMVNHAFEPLPPAYHSSVQQFDDGFGLPGWKMFFSEPVTAFALVVGGWVGEATASLPGRLLNVVIYSALWKSGYRSPHLIDFQDAKDWSSNIVQQGWDVNPTTAAVFAWATKNVLIDPALSDQEKN